MSCSLAEHLAQKTTKSKESASVVRLHLTYHPNDPPTKEIQQLWRDNVARPKGECPLRHCTNLDGEEVGFEQLVVAYHRPTNLGNLFSVRNIHGRGREVSSYLAE